MKATNQFTIQITLVLLAFTIILFICYPIFNDRYDVVQQKIEIRKNFQKYLQKYNKSYQHDNDEYQKRFEIFKTTMAFIETINKTQKYGDNVKFGLTKFSDLTDEEFSQLYLNDNKTTATQYRSKSENDISVPNYHIPKNLPLQVDWRKRGIVTGVRNQGKCGSCYAQSVIGAIESSIALKYNLSEPIELSIQQMIDCAENFNQGCLGGDTCDLLEWLKDEKISILPKTFYPDDKNYGYRNCKNITIPIGEKTAKVLKYTCLDFAGYEYEILNILAYIGPITASINGVLWKNYLGGIIKFHCNGPSNHAVQIVGYDLSPPSPYYIVRNSWGPEFGNDGYAKVAFGQNVCNIASEVSMVVVEWS